MFPSSVLTNLSSSRLLMPGYSEHHSVLFIQNAAPLHLDPFCGYYTGKLSVAMVSIIEILGHRLCMSHNHRNREETLMFVNDHEALTQYNVFTSDIEL